MFTSFDSMTIVYFSIPYGELVFQAEQKPLFPAGHERVGEQPYAIVERIVVIKLYSRVMLLNTQCIVIIGWQMH